MKEISNNSTNEELIEWAKEQCIIFPEDACMGKYLRKTIKMLEERKLAESFENIMWLYGILLEKVRRAREEINTDVRIAVKHFTNTDTVIDYVLDTIDELIESEDDNG